MGPPKGLLGVAAAFWGSWHHLGPPRAFWGFFSAFLGPSWGALGIPALPPRSAAVLILGPLGVFWRLLGPSWASWGLLAHPWASWGLVWRPWASSGFWGFLGPAGAFWGFLKPSALSQVFPAPQSYYFSTNLKSTWASLNHKATSFAKTRFLLFLEIQCKMIIFPNAGVRARDRNPKLLLLKRDARIIIKDW